MISPKEVLPAKRSATQASSSGFGGNIPLSEGRQHPFQFLQRTGPGGGEAPGTIFKRLPEFRQSRRVHQVRSQPQPDAFGPQELIARQGQVLGVARGTLGEEPARTADVREEADAGFGHGHAGGLGGHDDIRPGGQTQAAAHGDAVGQNHHRFGVLVDHEVQGILRLEELVGQMHRAGLDRLGKFFEVAPGAEAPVPRSGDYHQPDLGRGPGLFQGLGQKADHLPVEGVEDPGPVQNQGHQAGRPFYADGGICLLGHL